MTAEGTPTVDWRLIAQRLALALGNHRTDPHLNCRPLCATCQYSGLVLDEYLAAISADGGEGA